MKEYIFLQYFNGVWYSLLTVAFKSTQIISQSSDVISLLCLHRGIGFQRYLDFSMPKLRIINLLESMFYQHMAKKERMDVSIIPGGESL